MRIGDFYPEALKPMELYEIGDATERQNDDSGNPDQHGELNWQPDMATRCRAGP